MKKSLKIITFLDTKDQCEIFGPFTDDDISEILGAAKIRIEKREKKLSYQEYINSDEWKKKASEAKKRANWRCQICNKHQSKIPLHTHHRTYENLGNEKPEDLTVLCEDCHALFHGKG